MSEAPIPKKLKLIVKSNNNIKYSIDIYSNSNSFLQIDINSLNKIPQIYYQQQFSLENIKKLANYFLMCKSILDVLICLEPNIQNNNKIKLLEETNKINLIIPLNNPICPQIVFNVKQKQKVVSELMNEIYNTINNQQKEINKLNNEINNLEEMNESKKLNKKYKQWNKWIKEINKNHQNKINNLKEQLFKELEERKEKVIEIEKKKMKKNYVKYH